MAVAAVYFLTLGLYSFVVFGSALIRHDLMLTACIPPVFVALVMGFIMALYAGETFGWAPTSAALLIGAPVAWMASRRFRPRDLLLAIYLAWALALLTSLIGFSLPDQTA